MCQAFPTASGSHWIICLRIVQAFPISMELRVLKLLSAALTRSSNSSLKLRVCPWSSRQRYSNSNYNLLAVILEKVSGESYENYLRRHIFRSEPEVGLANLN